MANYENKGNRYTAIFVKQRVKGGVEQYVRAPFEMVRFNVDDNPDAVQEIVPLGELRQTPDGSKPDGSKVYEKIWIVDQVPFSAKTSFGNLT